MISFSWIIKEFLFEEASESIVKRLAVNTIRIAMTISTIRALDEDKLSKEIV